MLSDDDDEVAPSASKSQSSQQPAWMRTLLERCKEWIAALPEVSSLSPPFSLRSLISRLKKFNTLAPRPSENQDPLYRLFSREGTIGRRLLSQVRKDLSDVVKVCQGELKQTNHLRTLMSSLTKGTVHP